MLTPIFLKRFLNTSDGVQWGTDTKNPVNISQLPSKGFPTKENLGKNMVQEPASSQKFGP
jgi:hypothetical protein